MSEPRSGTADAGREEPVADAEDIVAEAEEAVVAETGDADAVEAEAADADVAAEAEETAGDEAPTDAGGESAEEEAAPDYGAPLEAILFSSELPLSAKRLAAWLKIAPREVLATIDQLNMFYGETGRAFRISPLAGGFQLVTTPEHSALLGKLNKERVPTRLSRAALETLSIIAFKQPVTRGEVDAIRGVSASDRVLRHLIERKLVRISGRAEAPGRPLLYGTTREFLGYFGLSAVSDLPRTDELEALLAGDLPQDAIDAEETTEDADVRGAETHPDGAESGGEEAEVAMMNDPHADGEAEEAPPVAEDDDEFLEDAAEETDAEFEDGLDDEIEDDDIEGGVAEDGDEDPSAGPEDDPDEEPSADLDGELEDDLAEDLAEDSAAEERKSHSGEESDEHEGISSPQ
ncbi:SMC-Scp complex subunit ScpB [bacterium]|nr:SMC-Scp complex subunit ScpB [bacterium]